MADRGPPPPNGDSNRWSAALIPEITAFSIAVVLLSLRMYVRINIIRKFWWDDVFILIAVVIGATKFCILGLEYHNGVGRHSYYLSPEQIVRAVEFETWSNFLISIGNLFLRLSVASMLFQLIASNKRWRFSLYGIIAFITVTNVTSAIIILTWCRPTKKIWNLTVPGECWSGDAAKWVAVYLNGVPAILCDTTLALIPVVFLWKVQINIRTKVGICCLMGLGLISASCAIVRTIMNSKLPIHDVTYTWVPIGIWSTMENLIGIIAACAATLKPLLRLKPISDWRSSRSGYISQSKHRLKLLNSPSPIGFKPEDSSSNIGNQTRATGHGQNTELSDDPSYIIEDPFHIKKTTEFEVHES